MLMTGPQRPSVSHAPPTKDKAPPDDDDDDDDEEEEEDVKSPKKRVRTGATHATKTPAKDADMFGSLTTNRRSE